MRLQCPACERELAPGALFCDACGARVSPPSPATLAEAPAERRPRRDVIEGLAASLPEAALQRAFRGLGERLLTDALGSYS